MGEVFLKSVWKEERQITKKKALQISTEGLRRKISHTNYMMKGKESGIGL